MCKLCLRLGEACCSLLLPKLWYLENDSIGHHLVKPQQQKELWRCSRASGSAHVGVTANTSNIEIVWKAVNRLNHFNGLWPKSKSKSVKGETTSSHNLTFLKGYETSQAHVNYVTSWVYIATLVTFTAWKNDAIKLNSDWGCQSSPLRFPGGKSNGFGATWVWVNDDRILIFEGTIPLKPRKKTMMYHICLWAVALFGSQMWLWRCWKRSTDPLVKHRLSGKGICFLYGMIGL